MSAVVDELLDLYVEPGAKEMQHIGSYELPSEAQVANIVDMCRALLFPGYAGGRSHAGGRVRIEGTHGG